MPYGFSELSTSKDAKPVEKKHDVSLFNGTPADTAGHVLGRFPLNCKQKSFTRSFWKKLMTHRVTQNGKHSSRSMSKCSCREW